MKRFLSTLLIALAFIAPVYTAAGVATAADQPTAANKTFSLCDQPKFQKTAACKDINKQKDNQNDPNGDPIIKIIQAALKIVSWVAGIAAIILILISGMKFMTAGGDPQGVKSARTHLTNAIIGIVILVIAQGILYLAIGTTR